MHRMMELSPETQTQDGKKKESTQPTAENWCAQFEAWAMSHRPSAEEADDSRKSIYQGRGD